VAFNVMRLDEITKGERVGNESSKNEILLQCSDVRVV
jgi:hypothetical protein